MKIEITRPEPYKNFIIVGVAIEAPRLKRWKLKGIVYSNSGKELKQLEPKQETVPDKSVIVSGFLTATGSMFTALSCSHY